MSNEPTWFELGICRAVLSRLPPQRYRLSNDMAACFEFAELDADALVTEDTVAALKAQASYSEPSVYQVCAFDDYVGSGMTFGQAAQETDDYCLAVAIRHCTEPLPEQCRLWADNVLG